LAELLVESGATMIGSWSGTPARWRLPPHDRRRRNVLEETRVCPAGCCRLVARPDRCARTRGRDSPAEGQASSERSTDQLPARERIPAPARAPDPAAGEGLLGRPLRARPGGE